jgi:hypothetical protein
MARSYSLPGSWLSHPKANIIAASHTVELAEKFGRRVRNAISEHSNTLGIELSSDSQAAGRWSLKSGGEYYAVLASASPAFVLTWPSSNAPAQPPKRKLIDWSRERGVWLPGPPEPPRPGRIII